MIGLDAIVRRRVTRAFDLLGRAEWEAVVADLAADVHHGHEFRVHRVAVAGPPWDMRVAVQWTATLRPAIGEPYDNEGTHWLRIHRGRVTGFHAYLNTQRIAEACEEMARHGIAEAAAGPITS